MIPTAYTTDTTPEAHAVQLECLRRMSGAEHFAMLCRMTANVRTMALDAIRRRHPDFSDEFLSRRIAFDDGRWNDVSRLVALLGNRIDLERLRQAGQSIGADDLVERLIQSHET